MRALFLALLYWTLAAPAAERDLDDLLDEAEATADRELLETLWNDADATIRNGRIIRDTSLVARLLLVRAKLLRREEAKLEAMRTARLLDPTADVSHLAADLQARWERLGDEVVETRVFVLEPELAEGRRLYVDGMRMSPERSDVPPGLSNPYRVQGAYHLWQVSGEGDDTSSAWRSEVRLLPEGVDKASVFEFKQSSGQDTPAVAEAPEPTPSYTSEPKPVQSGCGRRR